MWIALAAVALVIALIWIVGAREPVYRHGAGAEAWFVALRRPSTGVSSADGVQQAWSSRADFAFIGADEPYWSDFLILTGGDGRTMPIDLANVEDAYVARVRLQAPPRFALGFIRTLCVLGILSKPRGEILREPDGLGFRTDLMPTRQSIDTLLAKPAAYAPSMVNFLAYYPSANYARGASGAAAYRRYGMVAMRTVYRTGGALLFYGKVIEVLRDADAGPTVGRWGDVAAMRYPAPSAILSMEHAPDYRAALHHRDAGLERTVVIASH